MWNLKDPQTTTTKKKNKKQKKQKPKLTDTENSLSVARYRWQEVGKMDRGGQPVQTSHYRMNKSWRYDAQHGDCS